MASFFDTKIEFLRGIGPQRADLLGRELGIFTYGDLLEYFPFRHEDRTQFHTISQIRADMEGVQIKGRVKYMERLGEGAKERLIVEFTDGTGVVDLVWFQGISWAEKRIHLNSEYVIYGKPTPFGSKFSISHPEIEPLTPANSQQGYYQPIYSLTEKLRRRFIDSKAISGWVKILMEAALPHIKETLPADLISKYRLISKQQAIYHIHLPVHREALHQANRRLKFEELFYNQLRLVKQKLMRREEYEGQIFNDISLLTDFYTNHLPFQLTAAQARVVKEIVNDMRTGKQMNRLLQGDVGSGKTIVAFLCMLVAIGSGTQTCIMAPTEILATQHFNNIEQLAAKIGLQVALLTGSTPKKQRLLLHERLAAGSLHILVGTHALLEDVVQFQNLGLCVIDEQHRFGVAQRAKLWEKNKHIHPHILVMTATPIPRTLAMTLYGDLDISEIDELPQGRKPIRTLHKYDSHRLEVFAFMRQQLAEGRQIYVVYPLIEESEKLDLKNLMDGYESIARAFPTEALSIVHGKMKAKDKEYEMQRFKRGETTIMVATTVIEVGVDVPNASVMVIENSERFGLSQLHQLRGRVGRGADQSYCILLSDYKLSRDTRKRLQTMVESTNGFVISQVDLELRGPGDMAGTQQSGVIDLKVANLGKDGEILRVAREEAIKLLEADPTLSLPPNQPIRQQIEHFNENETYWAKIL